MLITDSMGGNYIRQHSIDAAPPSITSAVKLHPLDPSSFNNINKQVISFQRTGN